MDEDINHQPRKMKNVEKLFEKLEHKEKTKNKVEEP